KAEQHTRNHPEGCCVQALLAGHQRSQMIRTVWQLFNDHVKKLILQASAAGSGCLFEATTLKGWSMKYNVLILGASYGSLFSTKLLMSAHSVSLVSTRPTAKLINREGTVVRFPIRGRQSPVDIS